MHGTFSSLTASLIDDEETSGVVFSISEPSENRAIGISFQGHGEHYHPFLRSLVSLDLISSFPMFTDKSTLNEVLNVTTKDLGSMPIGPGRLGSETINEDTASPIRLWESSRLQNPP